MHSKSDGIYNPKNAVVRDFSAIREATIIAEKAFSKKCQGIPLLDVETRAMIFLKEQCVHNLVNATENVNMGR